MSIASTFRNIVLSAGLVTASGLSQSEPIPPEYTPPATNPLQTIVNATQASEEHSTAFFQAIQREAFFQKPEYAFDVTQRCKAKGKDTSLDEFAACARKERSRDFQKNLVLLVSGTGLLLSVASLGFSLALRKREELSSQNDHHLSHHFE